jgi:hypothetical protein
VCPPRALIYYSQCFSQGVGEARREVKDGGVPASRNANHPSPPAAGKPAHLDPVGRQPFRLLPQDLAQDRVRKRRPLLQRAR